MAPETNRKMRSSSMFRRSARRWATSRITNIAKLHLLFGGDFQRDSSNSLYDMPGQTSLYYSGVGTSGNWLNKKIEFFFALRDVDEIIKDALEDLRNIYNPRDKVFVTGFSRGAATARKFCAKVAGEKDLSDIKIEFLICFDTVASIGMPDVSTFNRPKSEVLEEDKKIAPNVVQALHCCSIGGNDRAYQPTLMNQEDRVIEVWFAGAHKDVGGGYFDSNLSDVALEFVLSEIAHLKVGLQVLSMDEIKLDKINAGTDGVVIEQDDIEMQPNVLGTDHTKPMDLFRYHRKVVVISDDKIVQDALPIVRYSVADRIKRSSVDPPYRPSNLDVPHKVLMGDGTYFVMGGLDDYILSMRSFSKRKVGESTFKAVDETKGQNKRMLLTAQPQ